MHIARRSVTVGRPLEAEIREQLAREVEATSPTAVAARIGIARHTLERALWGGGLYAGTTELIRRHVREGARR
jgi:hypothetical protein